jgi:hypothetical protein
VGAGAGCWVLQGASQARLLRALEDRAAAAAATCAAASDDDENKNQNEND